MSSYVVGNRDSWYEAWALLIQKPFVHLFGQILQVGPRFKFQQWFHSLEHPILFRRQSEEKTASLLVFNKIKGAFSPDTPRESLLSSYWLKLVLNTKAFAWEG